MMMMMRKDVVAMASSIDEELKLVCKLTRFMYELSLLYDVADVGEGMREARQLAESYEEIHVKLKRELGDEDYNENYPGYDAQISKITDWIMDAKLEIRKKKESRSNEAEQEKLEGSIKEIYKLRVEVKYLERRIKSGIARMYAENNVFVEDLEKHFNIAQRFIEEWTGIFVRIEASGSQYSEEFVGIYDELCNELDLFIQGTSKRMQEVKFSKLEVEKERKNEELEREERLKLGLCHGIYENICERFSNLEMKCNIQLEDLSDSDILHEKGN